MSNFTFDRSKHAVAKKIFVFRINTAESTTAGSQPEMSTFTFLPPQMLLDPLSSSSILCIVLNAESMSFLNGKV